jgi:tetratricopeptide (TPR) repeat protein
VPSLEQLKKLLAIEPNDPFVLYGLAQEHARLGDHAAALDWYDKCLAADPHYCYAYYHKARSQQALDRTSDAIATVRAGLDASKAAGDNHAASELASLLDELT